MAVSGTCYFKSDVQQLLLTSVIIAHDKTVNDNHHHFERFGGGTKTHMRLLKRLPKFEKFPGDKISSVKIFIIPTQPASQVIFLSSYGYGENNSPARKERLWLILSSGEEERGLQT